MKIATPDEMAELGARIARELRAGDLVLLNGELGAGKTTLTRAIGETLGVRGAVTSPTFVLARTHPRVSTGSTTGDRAKTTGDRAKSRSDDRAQSRSDDAPLVHVDAYRLGSAMELDDLDIDFASSIVVIEWGAGLTDGIADSWLVVDIVRPHGAGDRAQPESDDDGVEPREVTITAFGPRWQGTELLDAARH